MLDTILAATPSILNSTATLVKSANTPGLPYYPGQSPGTAFGSVSVGSSNGLIWVLLFGGAAVLLLGRR